MTVRDNLIIGGALIAICAGLGLKFYEDGKASQKPVIEQKADDAAARGLEVQGERSTAARVDAHAAQTQQIQEATRALAEATRAAPTQPLPVATAARLRAHDDVLCRAKPYLCHVTAPAADGPPRR